MRSNVPRESQNRLADWVELKLRTRFSFVLLNKKYYLIYIFCLI